MAKYETMLIPALLLDEEATAALLVSFKTLIENNGTIDSIDEWGKRRLALPHQRRGGRRLHCDQLHQRAQLPR